MPRISSLFTLIILFTSCTAQQKYSTTQTVSSKARNAFDSGIRMSFNGQYQRALIDFERAIQISPNFIDAHIEWANTKNQLGLLADAETGYERALSIDSTFDYSIYYSLGIVEFEQRKFEEATLHFHKYLASGRTSEKRRTQAETYLKNSDFAARALNNPVPFQPINIGLGINTEEAEYLPTLSADGETLIYTAVRSGQEDFYRSKKVDGTWQKGEPISALNSPNNEGAQSMSADGKLLVFTACHRREGLGSCDIFFSEFKNGAWTAVRNIGSPVNTRGWDSQPSLSAGGKTLYFISDRQGGIGGKDIWISQRLPNGSWGTPVNAGPPLNTPQDEQSPFIHADGKTLYFMSNGHPGMGGFDLYLARKNAEGTWAEPVNLGYPINTEANEGALSVSLDGKTAFFATDLLKIQSGISSFDNPQGKATTDIYSFELHEAIRPVPSTYVKARVKDATSGKPLPANVEVVDLSSRDGNLFASSDCDENGEFLIAMPMGPEYALNVELRNYLFHSEHFSLTEAGTVDKPFLLDIILFPISQSGEMSHSMVPEPVILKNVFFETGSAKLKGNSRVELNKLRDFLKKNNFLKIQINGHTDDQGTDEDNLVLSNNRAKAVYDYLVSAGIAPDRLNYSGYGESKPIADNSTEEGRQQNRRTDFVIIE